MDRLAGDQGPGLARGSARRGRIRPAHDRGVERAWWRRDGRPRPGPSGPGTCWPASHDDREGTAARVLRDCGFRPVEATRRDDEPSSPGAQEFTPAALRALNRAESILTLRGDQSIDTEHVLLARIEEPGSWPGGAHRGRRRPRASAPSCVAGARSSASLSGFAGMKLMSKQNMEHARIDISQGLDGEPVVYACFDLLPEEIAASTRAVAATAPSVTGLRPSRPTRCSSCES